MSDLATEVGIDICYVRIAFRGKADGAGTMPMEIKQREKEI